MAGDRFTPVVLTSPKLKSRYLNVSPPAPLKATLANVAHLETGMILPADDDDVARMMRRPYTSGGDSTHLTDSCFGSLFSTRPSTSLYSGASRASSRSWRKRRSPPSPSSFSVRTQADSRGYESFEQLLTPSWRSRAELQSPPAPMPRAPPTSTGGEGTPTPRTPLGRALWSKAKELIPPKPSTAPAAQLRSPGVVVEEGKRSPRVVVEEDSSAAADSSSESGSEDSVDPILTKAVGALLPTKNLWSPVVQKAKANQQHNMRRTGLDEEMMELAKYAVAAQQAALREEEERNMPTQVLPGVYFGHADRPDVSRLPASGRLARLQRLQLRKIREDTAEERQRYHISDQVEEQIDPRFVSLTQDPRRALKEETPRANKEAPKARVFQARKAVVTTWEGAEKEEAQQRKVLSKEEQAKLKEEKVAYDDWRRQVMVCTRLLNTHINRFETDPVKLQPQYIF